MKVRSNALWQYLADSGALNGSDEDIFKAKLEYRKIYKREWKKRQKLPKKELRPIFTLKEYQHIRLKAAELKLNATAYLKAIALASVEGRYSIENKEILQKVLQLLSMSVIALKHNHNKYLIEEQLEQAEKLLLEYVK